MKTTKFFYFFLILAMTISCSKKDDENDTNDTPGILGAVGNNWHIKLDGVADLTAEIIAKEGNVSTVQVSYGKLSIKEVKFGKIGNEIVDYVYSDGDVAEPFTMVKFDATVGDSYGATIDGVYHYREVFEKESYYIDALGKTIETIGIYEWIPYETPSTYFGLTIRSIYWYWHPVYGLVCVEFTTEEGDFYEVVFVNIDV
ncbi:MAG: hypothetical protein K9G76_04010 [Bacteroidales bacterium]|nr:hypothetical protein [Bacteroidales bacterium]MCF8403587.1 hypothetical protein [Bacteroidales bacterium]